MPNNVSKTSRSYYQVGKDVFSSRLKQLKLVIKSCRQFFRRGACLLLSEISLLTLYY